jgi:hypothetical protein
MLLLSLFIDWDDIVTIGVRREAIRLSKPRLDLVGETVPYVAGIGNPKVSSKLRSDGLERAI